MTAPASVEKRSVTRESFKEVSRMEGPFLSLFLPRYAPGAANGSDHVWLKNTMNEIRLDLERHHFPPDEIAQLTAPLSELLNAEGPREGHQHGDAWFLAAEGAVRLDGDGLPGRGYVVGQQPYLLPLLRALALPGEYYILGLAKQNLTLFQCRHGECHKVDLPANVPLSLETMLEFDPPDHDRDNRVSAGTMPGQGTAVRFGTGDEAETQPEYLHQYFKQLDTRVFAALENKAAPVVLAGVRYETAEFQRVAQSLNVVQEGTVEGAWKDLTPAELLAQSAGVLRSRYMHAVKEVAERLRETDRKVTTLNEALHAAVDGRVWKLFIPEDSPSIWLQNWREHLELNKVVVEAIRRGADVYLTPPELMPEGAAVAAMLRY